MCLRSPDYERQKTLTRKKRMEKNRLRLRPILAGSQLLKLLIYCFMFSPEVVSFLFLSLE